MEGGKAGRQAGKKEGRKPENEAKKGNQGRKTRKEGKEGRINFFSVRQLFVMSKTKMKLISFKRFKNIETYPLPNWAESYEKI